MDPIVFIIVAAIIVWLLNIGLSFLQIRDFNNNYIELRRRGKVAIGRKKGRITSGTIVLIQINDDGNIVETRRMQGFTVFARIKVFTGLENKNLAKINESDLNNFDKLLKFAINDAKNQYLAFKKESYGEKKEGIAKIRAV